MPFSSEQCDALFAAVLIDDEIDLTARLPDNIHLDYSQTQLDECYQICLQLWQWGVNKQTLIMMTKKLYRQKNLASEDRLTFKYIRAKFKLLRFAYTYLSYRHRHPYLFNHITIIMGKLQDSFKNKQNFTTKYLTIYLRLLLSKFVYSLAMQEIEQFRVTSPMNFEKHMKGEIAFIRSNITQEQINSKQFHEIRKVISRQVAFYSCLIILYPSSYHTEIFRYLSTINGLMGERHDELITRKFEKTKNYYSEMFVMPDEIKKRLLVFLGKYP